MKKLFPSLTVVRVLFITIWIQSTFASGATGQTTYGTALPAESVATTVFLPFPTPKSHQVFRQPIVALKIERVECDGKQLAVSGTIPMGCYPDVSTITTDSDTWMYEASLIRLSYQVEREAPMYPVEIEYIDMPASWYKLSISYRVRLPDGTTSKKLTTKIKKEKRKQ